MPYTTNPSMPRVRAKAVQMVLSGKTISETARYFGYSKSAVCKWCQKVPVCGAYTIPTLSSKPKSHPNAISYELNKTIIAYKNEFKRCSDVIHKHLNNDGFKVSLNTVKRKLDQAGLIKKRSPWKKLHLSTLRPEALNPGDLMMVDTIHFMLNPFKKIYVYTLIDVYSRWCYAWATETINTKMSIKFLQQAQKLAQFSFKCIQSDNGSEFSQHFTERITIAHRHSRVRKPNDNAFVERFNRTLQEECLNSVITDVSAFNQALSSYLYYYNTKRLHMGINFNTPISLIQRFQAIG
jgi:transposase InsO family protein